MATSTITLSAEQVTEITAPSKRYAESAYAEVLSTARSTGNAVGHVETLFPGVKIAHVVFMLKKLRGDAKDVVIDSHGVYGVCVIPVAPAKPKRERKPRAKKSA